jgi:hypothetical protein
MPHGNRPIPFVAVVLAISTLSGCCAYTAAPASPSRDPIAREDLANQLAREGKSKEALEQYLWCFDHGLENDRAYDGVRASFLISDIRRLGQTYPPAIDALRQRMDLAKQSLLSGNGQPRQADDFALLAVRFGEFDRVMTLLGELSKRHPESLPLTERIVDPLLNNMLMENRYLQIVEAVPQDRAWLDAQLNRSRELMDYMQARAAGSVLGALQVAFIGTYFTTSHTESYFEALAGAGRRREAEYLAVGLMDIDGSQEMRTRLSEAAKRAGNDDLANRILQGLQTASAETAPS